ncbi:MAG: DUF3592 domain-containing protein [Solirubrobacteraceae bacterium]
MADRSDPARAAAVRWEDLVVKQSAAHGPHRDPSHRTAADWVSGVAPVAFGLIAIIGCTFWLLQAFQESSRTSGTVTSSHGRSCSIAYRDGTGTSHTYDDEGGKSGCSFRVGQRVSVYYDASNPENAALSPSRVQVVAAAVGVVIGFGFLFMNQLVRLSVNRKVRRIHALPGSRFSR